MSKKFFFLTTILLVVFFMPKIASANIVINEVYYDPTGTDTGLEYVILYNNGDSDIDLTNWDLDPSSAPYYTFPSFTLKAKNFVTIHINTTGTDSNTDLYDNGSSNMSNTKGPIALFNSTTHSISTIIDYIEYGEGGQTNESKAVSAGIWTAGDFIPDVDSGKAIKLKTDGVDNNLSSDWIESDPTAEETPEETIPSEGPTESEAEAPSSGATNQPPISDAGDNIIAFIGQEINFDGTKSIDPDGDELAYSWNMGDGKLIEEPIITYQYLYPGTYLVTLMVYDGLYYASDTITVKIQSQKITINEFIPNPAGSDDEEWIEIYNDSNSIVDISGWQLDDEEEGSKPFNFPQNTLIAPKSYLVFPRQITKIALNNDGDSVRLLLPGGIVFQEIQYGKSKEGQSSANTPEGFVWSVPTPGMANIFAAPEGIGGLEQGVAYQYQVEPEITKELTQDYSWYYEPPSEEVKGGYIEIEQQSEKQSFSPEDQLAMIPSEAQVAKIIETEDKVTAEQSTANLILMTAAIILGALIIGIIITKSRKKI